LYVADAISNKKDDREKQKQTNSSAAAQAARQRQWHSIAVQLWQVSNSCFNKVSKNRETNYQKASIDCCMFQHSDMGNGCCKSTSMEVGTGRKMSEKCQQGNKQWLSVATNKATTGENLTNKLPSTGILLWHTVISTRQQQQ